MKEIREILGDLGYEICSMKEAGISVDIVEDGKTFEENALIKARAVAACCDALVLADDSGLEVDYLDKAPGIYSARFLGEDTSYEIKNAFILKQLEGVEKQKRTARFVSAIAAVLPDKTELTALGTIEGYIGYKSAGENGFGYDPIFYLPEYQCTTSELELEKKNELSHRGKALRQMKERLKEWLKEE